MKARNDLKNCTEWHSSVATKPFFEDDGTYYGLYVDRKHEHEWYNLKETFEKRFNTIYEEIGDQFKEKKWYIILGKIKTVYSQFPEIRGIHIMNNYNEAKWKPWPQGKLVLHDKACIICEDETHRTRFDSNKVYRFEHQ